MGIPLTIFIRANFGDDTIKLVEMLEKFEFCSRSVNTCWKPDTI